MKKNVFAGEVVAVEDGKAVIELQPPASCGSGLACSCCSGFRPQPRRVRLDRGDLEVGDRVQVTVPAYLGYVSILVVFVLPIALFVGGMLVGGLFEPAGGSRGMPSVLGGLAGFALAVVIALVAERAVNRSSCYEVVRIGQGEL